MLHYLLTVYVFMISSWQAGWYFEDRTSWQNYLEAIFKI